LPDGHLLLSVENWSVTDVERLLDASRRFASGLPPVGERLSRFTAGLVFLAPSLRTRVGFAEAAMRLGGGWIDANEVRREPRMSSGESFADTLRTVSGMTDVVVVRTPFPLDPATIAGSCVCPLINAGDGWNEHPTQALIDLFAIEQECGPIGRLRLAMCGDLGMRTARSLLRLLHRFPPHSLILIAPESRRLPSAALGPRLADRTAHRADADFREIDVLYMVGLPAKGGDDYLDDDVRGAFALTGRTLETLPRKAVVLSPLPVIDEITADARLDPRVRVFRQSDRGVFVRMAILESMVTRTLA
jgi:aspartate carbamoyltransferase catalytic subunit